MRQLDAFSTNANYSGIAKKSLTFLMSVLFVTVLFAQTTISSFAPSSGSVGTLVTIRGTNLTSPSALTIGGVAAIAVSNTGTALVAMVMPGAVTGAVVVTKAGSAVISASNFTVIESQTPNGQQGSKLVGSGAIGSAQQGYSVSLSADGNTAILGGIDDNNGAGAAWIYTRSGGVWSQQGAKLVGSGAIGPAHQGVSVSVSADGNTAIVGGYADNSNAGAAWIYTRSGGVWSQQGEKIVSSGAIGRAAQGYRVSLSADGNTAIVGGYADNSNAGAAWVYTRSGGVWIQQGSKLVGSGATVAAQQGYSVSLSADGSTAIVGGNADQGGVGAAWVYTRSGGGWSQQGAKLVGSGAIGRAAQGFSVSLSADGNTAIVGGASDNNSLGAAWVFTRSGGVWSQQGAKLVGTGAIGSAAQGFRVSISADGNKAMVGGYADNSSAGAAWIYTRSGGVWSQQGAKLVGSGATGAAQQRYSVSLSADGNTAIVGGDYDNNHTGAAWVHTYVPPPTITNFTANIGPVGTLVTITGTNFNNPTALTIGGVSAITISNTGTSLVAMVMPGTVTGTIVVTTASGTATSGSNFTIIASSPPSKQQGSKLVGATSIGSAHQGFSVSMSADGNTAIVGGENDNNGTGAAWVYTRSGNLWIQQGPKLVGSGAVGPALQGYSVSLSADGNTAMVGGPSDDGNAGAAWVYTRSGGEWSQQGSKLVGSGAIGPAVQGTSVSLSADGNTAIVGGKIDNSSRGAAWVYTRSGSAWIQQGSKLVGGGATGAAQQGNSVSLSADGNTAMVGGADDNSAVGAAWVYICSGGVWRQQGSKLVGSGAIGFAQQGYSVSLSADGNTAIVGGKADNNGAGAAWIYTRSGGVWSQQGAKLVGTGAFGAALQGWSVSISADGNTAMVGGEADNLSAGAAWVYTRSGVVWSQQGSKLVGSLGFGPAQQGYSVSLSAVGNTAIVSGYADNNGTGAAWVFTPPIPTITNFAASSGPIGTLVKITGTNLGSPATITIGGVSAIPISNTGTSLVAMVMPGATTGAVSITTAGGTADGTGNFTVTASQTPISQQGSKLVGTGATGASRQGYSVSVSADGNTAIVGGASDSNVGAAWVFTRIGGVWSQQGSKLVGSGAIGAAQGISVSVSADGNTAMVGGPSDNNGAGAAWVYTRSGSVWSQQGSKLVGSGAIGPAHQGVSVSVSADGNTAIVGGYADNSNAGAAWIYTRSGSVWSQQGAKLVGTGAIGSALQGWSVSISADGNTAMVGGDLDNSALGAAWVYTCREGVWSQQGTKLVGTESPLSTGYQGFSVSISADGNTAIVGGRGGAGAAWVYTRSGGIWSQQGSKLVGTGATGTANQGYSVSISADGNTAMVGGNLDNNSKGAVWVYNRSGGVWSQQGSKLVGIGATGAANQGCSVSISADGNTGMVGGNLDNGSVGAAWAFITPNKWTGTTNTDWATATNWTYGTVPINSEAVIIPNVSNKPIIGNSTTAALNNLTINSSAILTVNGILQIGGTISNSGTFNATNGTITMNGSSAQTIPASAFSTNTINNLILNNSAGLTLAGTLNVTGTITPNFGTLTTGGFLTLISTVYGSGNIARGFGTYLSGNVTVQRYVGSSHKWRMIGFPFTAATTIAQNKLSGFYTSGFKAYTYNESGDNGAYGRSGSVNAGWNLFTSGTITANKGLLLNGGTIPATINFSGPVNTETQTISLSYTSGNSDKGWNLIANPYASNINWTTIKANHLNANNLDNAIYRYDPNTTSYASYVNGINAGNQNNIIENGAGFFVHSTGATTLTIAESDKVSTAPLLSLFDVNPIVAQQKSIIKLALVKQGETTKDEVVVRWGVDPATDNFDGNYDAYDMGRAVGPDLSVIGNDKTVYSIFHGSALTTYDTENRTVQLGIKNMEEGSYTIGIELLSTIANGNKAYLFDSYTNQYTLMDGNTNSYSFITTIDTISQSKTRFSIVLNAKQLINNTDNSNLSVILLNNPSTGNLFTLYSKTNFNQLQWQIVDAVGRVLKTGLISNVLKGYTYQFNGGAIAKGNYFIKLNGDGNGVTVLKAIKN